MPSWNLCLDCIASPYSEHAKVIGRPNRSHTAGDFVTIGRSIIVGIALDGRKGATVEVNTLNKSDMLINNFAASHEEEGSLMKFLLKSGI